ncbi:MAG: carboxypeptidase-like regulatory domain-containing protein, partial [Desulfomonilaceae bacterium]
KEKSAAATEQEKKPVSFKFSSAVDIPTQEEIGRRDKAQLVVSGFVTGPDGRGLPSVLVYLTDLQGNRVGQSCRTLAETGEYKVLASEPGKYVLRAHKRGMMMENSDGVPLPMESGKIEGLNFSMIPDGCVVKGRIVLSDALEPVPHTAVRCRSRLGDYTGESVTDADGNFSIVGAPPNCECYVEVIDGSGKRVHVTEHFETVQKNQISLEIQLKETPSRPLRSNEPSPTVPKVEAGAEEVSPSPE